MKPIAISAGHFPDRKGAFNQNHKLWEFHVCYELALDIAAKLDDQGIPILLVPTGPLVQKIAFINKNNPLCAVEIHLNSFYKVASGTECLYYPSDEKGRILATYLQTSLVNNLHLRDRGIVARKNLAFLAKVNCPRIITESLFLNNDEEVQQYLLTTQGKERIIQGHAEGIAAYYGRNATI